MNIYIIAAVGLTLVMWIGASSALVMPAQVIPDAYKDGRKRGVEEGGKWLHSKSAVKKALSEKSHVDKSLLHHAARDLFYPSRAKKNLQETPFNRLTGLMEKYRAARRIHFDHGLKKGPRVHGQRTVLDYPNQFREDLDQVAQPGTLLDPTEYFTERDEIPGQDKRDEGAFDHEFPEELEALTALAKHRRAEQGSQKKGLRGFGAKNEYKARLNVRDYPWLGLGG